MTAGREEEEQEEGSEGVVGCEEAVVEARDAEVGGGRGGGVEGRFNSVNFLIIPERRGAVSG